MSTDKVKILKWLQDETLTQETVAEWIQTLLDDVARLNEAADEPFRKEPVTQFVRMFGCCGFREIDYLSQSKTPEAALLSLYPNVEQVYWVPAFVFFSQSRLDSMSKEYFTHLTGRSQRPYGTEFAAYLKLNNLGEVVYLGERVNLNTGRLVAGWIWHPDKNQLKVFIKALEVRDNKAKEAWSGQIEAARGQGAQLGQVDGGQTATEPGGANGGGIGGGMAEAASGNPT